jgi:hypothetical protein
LGHQWHHGGLRHELVRVLFALQACSWCGFAALRYAAGSPPSDPGSSQRCLNPLESHTGLPRKWHHLERRGHEGEGLLQLQQSALHAQRSTMGPCDSGNSTVIPGKTPVLSALNPLPLSSSLPCEPEPSAPLEARAWTLPPSWWQWMLPMRSAGRKQVFLLRRSSWWHEHQLLAP